MRSRFTIQKRTADVNYYFEWTYNITLMQLFFDVIFCHCARIKRINDLIRSCRVNVTKYAPQNLLFFHRLISKTDSTFRQYFSVAALRSPLGPPFQRLAACSLVAPEQYRRIQRR